MTGYCGADCDSCRSRESCRGCRATCGSPFGGRCTAAEYIKSRGPEAYRAFKQGLLGEVNALLAAEGFPAAEKLYELPGSYINLEYPLPGGEKVKFLKDEDVYLGAQVEQPGNEACIGAAADTPFILLCRYGAGGSDPELLLYKKR